MSIVKYNSLIPNVGIGFLLFLLLGSIPASAAYTIVEDEGDQISRSAASILIPFYAARYRLGPKGRAAMEKATEYVRTAAHIEIVARGNKKGDKDLPKKRGATLKQWLTTRGIPAARINIRLDLVPQADDSPNIFLTEIKCSNDERPTPPLVAASTLAAAETVPAPLVENILLLYRSGQLSTDVAIKLLSSANSGQSAPMQTARIAIVATPTTWILQGNSTLRDNLTRWAAIAGWNPPDWQLSDPYYIDDTFRLHGTLIDAIKEIGKAVPGLDFLISIRNRTITVTKGGNP